LVCGWDFLVEFASTAYMAGVLIGALASGTMSDRWDSRARNTGTYTPL